MEKIDSFRGKHYFLSNFYHSAVYVDNIKFPTAEHAYQYHKLPDVLRRPLIGIYTDLSVSPGRIKRESRSHPMREGWEQTKIPIMYFIVRSKFMQSTILRQKLLETGDAQLIESNHWGDRFWGVCEGRGLNMLGNILMFVRSEFEALIGRKEGELRWDGAQEAG